MAFFLFSSDARADVTISVTPSFLEFAVDAGTIFDEVITVSNEGSTATGIVVAVRDSADSLPEFSSTGWIQATPNQFQLGPGELQEVAVHVEVPAAAQSGGRYATIFFRNASLNVGAGAAEGFFGASGLGGGNRHALYFDCPRGQPGTGGTGF